MTLRRLHVSVLSAIALILTVLLGGVPPVHAVLGPTKIMLVGDSITQGSASDFTWRHRLAGYLDTTGVPYDLVGPRDDLFDSVTNTAGSQAYRDPSFDTDHNAFWGSTLGQHADSIRMTTSQSLPSIIVVHLGINDLAWGGDVATAESSLRRFIAEARASNSAVRLVMGEVLKTQGSVTDTALAAKIDSYNVRLRAVAVELTSTSSPITVVAAAPTWTPSTSTYDGTHPNPRGEYVIAKAYGDALASTAGIGPGFGPLPSTFPTFPGPGSLTAEPTSNGVLLEWPSVPGATGYYIYQRNVTQNGQLARLPYPVQGTSFQGGLLTNGDQYEWRVSSIRWNEEGAQSVPALATPVGLPPAAPSNLVASPRDGGALLTWTEPAGAVDYFIYQRDVTTGGSFSRLPWPVQGSSWVGGLLANDHIWEFKLVARNGNGESTFSNVAQVTPRASLPNTPVGLAAVPGNGSANLSWTPAAGASGYYIWQRNVTAGHAFARLPWPVQGASFTAGLLTNDQVWEFKVTATNAAGTSGFSNVATVTPRGVLPQAPTDLVVSARDGAARLEWRGSSGATGYYIYQRDVTAGQAFGRLPYPVTATSFTAGLLTNGHVWEFKVAAINASGTSPYSNTAQVRPTGPVPVAPTNLTATGGDARVNLTWSSVSGATGYYIYQRDVTAGQAFVRLPYAVGSPSFQAGLLTNGHTWQFAVAAINSNGESDRSATASAVPRGALPATPSGLSAVAGDATAKLAWTGVSGATGYVVYQRDATAGQGFTRLPIALSGTSWTASLLTNGHVYEFKLRSQNLNGESGYSSTVSVKPVAVPPAAPASFRALPVDRGIQMTWAAVPNATGYWVYSRRHGSTTTQIVAYTKDRSHRFGTYGSSRWKVWVVAERYGTLGATSPVRELYSFANDYSPGWWLWPVDEGTVWQNQCTAFAAWRVNVYHPEAFGFWYASDGLPHAKRWAAAATAYEDYMHRGLAVSSTPRIGDIAQWSYEEYGHVAFVAAIDGTNIYLEEYNFSNVEAYGTRVIQSGSQYIHFARSS